MINIALYNVEGNWLNTSVFVQYYPLTASSSSSYIFGAGGNLTYGLSVFEAFCTLTPVLVPSFIPEPLHARLRERPLLAKDGIMGEKWPVKFSQLIRLQRNFWVL
jgi:hypothetical protein